ncbi:MAG: DinB family protein [Candidatus Acidiferrales bacterium]
MRRKATNPQIQLLLRELDQAYDKKAWHGTTLRGSLRGLTVKEALWRPARGRHNIWELVLHAAYWKYIVLRKLSGDSELKFPRPGSNFPRLPKKTDSKAWGEGRPLIAGATHGPSQGGGAVSSPPAGSQGKEVHLEQCGPHPRHRRA